MFGLLIVYCSKEILSPPPSPPKPELPRSPRDVYFWCYIWGRVKGSEGLTFLFSLLGVVEWRGIMGDMVVRHERLNLLSVDILFVTAGL